MNTVKTIKRDNYTLIHSWYYDDFGLKRNLFELVSIEDNGHKVSMPFWGMLRTINGSKGTVFLGDDITPYTDEQYNEMLDEQIKRFTR